MIEAKQKENILIRVGSIAIGVLFIVTFIHILTTQENLLEQYQCFNITQKISVSVMMITFLPVSGFFIYSGIKGRVPKFLEKYNSYDYKK